MEIAIITMIVIGGGCSESKNPTPERQDTCSELTNRVIPVEIFYTDRTYNQMEVKCKIGSDKRPFDVLVYDNLQHKYYTNAFICPVSKKLQPLLEKATDCRIWFYFPRYEGFETRSWIGDLLFKVDGEEISLRAWLRENSDR